LNQPDPHELIHPPGQFFFHTDNLPVKSGTSRSWDTSKGGQQGFVVASGFGHGQVEIVVDPLPIGLDTGLVLSNFFVTRLSLWGWRQYHKKGPTQKDPCG